MGSSVEEIKEHVHQYLVVFAALGGLTVVTVTISYIPLPQFAAVGVALLVATVKGSLVAAYFMHLISEKKVIYWVLVLTVVFFIVLMAVPSMTSIW